MFISSSCNNFDIKSLIKHVSIRYYVKLDRNYKINIIKLIKKVNKIIFYTENILMTIIYF